MAQHPILRDLKNDLQALRASCRRAPGSGSGSGSGTTCLVDTSAEPAKKVLDSNPKLAPFCKTLEAAFKHGLIHEDDDGQGHYFEVFEAIASEQNREQGLNALVRHIVAEIGKMRCLTTGRGRGRYFFRCCLNNGWLSSLVMSLRNWSSVSTYYHPDALLLRNPKESLMEILPALDLLAFNLHLANRSFLDDSWDLPAYRKYELVPCSDLGLMICAIDSRIVVTKVKSYSIAGEDNKVGVGDVIDDVDATPTFGLAPEAVADIVKKCARRPIALGVVKAQSRDGPKVYPPLKRLLKESGVDQEELEQTWVNQRNRRKWSRTSFELGHDDDCFKDDGEDEFNPLLEDEEDEEDDSELKKLTSSSTQSKSSSSMAKAVKNGGQDLLYIGSLRVGKVGDSSLLDRAIHRVIHDQKKVHHSVSLHLQELGIKMFCNDTGRQALHYTYPEISACGCSSTDNHYLAFIAGNNLCSLATDFLCHVFYCANQAKAKDIITVIAEGFDRTRNAV